MTSLDFALDSGGTLTLKVLDAQGQPVQNASAAASSGHGWRAFSPGPDGRPTAAGLAPGKWEVTARVRSGAKYRPLSVEVRGGAQEVEIHAATDGVTVKFEVAGGAAQWMTLLPGAIAAPSKMSEFEALGAAESVLGSVAKNVLPGTWTLMLMRADGQELATHTFQVTAAPEQDVKLTPQWHPVSQE